MYILYSSLLMEESSERHLPEFDGILEDDATFKALLISLEDVGF